MDDKTQSSFCSKKILIHKEINNHFVANDDPGGGDVPRVHERDEIHFVVNDQEFECFSSGSGAESYQEVYVGTGRCIHFVGSVSRDCRPTL